VRWSSWGWPCCLPRHPRGTGPGTWTQADINASIDKALAYLDTQQNRTGATEPRILAPSRRSRWVPTASRATAPPAGRADPSPERDQVTCSRHSNPTAPSPGRLLPDLTTPAPPLIALRPAGRRPHHPAGAIPTAIASARQYLVGARNSPPQVSCQSTGRMAAGSGAEFLRRLGIMAPRGAGPTSPTPALRLPGSSSLVAYPRMSHR